VLGTPATPGWSVTVYWIFTCWYCTTVTAIFAPATPIWTDTGSGFITCCLYTAAAVVDAEFTKVTDIVVFTAICMSAVWAVLRASITIGKSAYTTAGVFAVGFYAADTWTSKTFIAFATPTTARNRTLIARALVAPARSFRAADVWKIIA